MQKTNIFSLLKPKALTSVICEDSTVRQALEKMKHHGFTSVPVIDEEGKFVKTVSEGDFLWFIISKDVTDMIQLEQYSVRDMPSKTKIDPVSVQSTMADLFKLSMNQNYVPVIDDRDVFIGIVTRRDILAACYDALSESEIFSAAHEYEREGI